MANLVCIRCGATHRADVQFKTGNDSCMEHYEDGDVVDDLDGGDLFDGIGDAHCRDCRALYLRVQFEAARDALLSLVEDGSVRAAGDVELAYRALWASEGVFLHVNWYPLPDGIRVERADASGAWVSVWPLAEGRRSHEEPFYEELQRRTAARLAEWSVLWVDVPVRIVREWRGNKCIDRVRVGAAVPSA